MSNKVIILWGFLIISIVITIFIIGKINERDYEYNEIKEELKENAKKYLDDENAWPLENEEIDVTSEELINKSYIEKLIYKDKNCIGKVTIKNQKGKYKYLINIECVNEI